MAQPFKLIETVRPFFRKPKTVEKGWGKELIFANNDLYCGKLLCFNKGEKFSMHYHLKKTESFLIFKGLINFIYFDLRDATERLELLTENDVIDIPIGCPHQIEALEDTIIIEVSTTHTNEDNYRIKKGSSQK